MLQEKATDKLSHAQLAEEQTKTSVLALATLSQVFKTANKLHPGSEPVYKLKTYLSDFCQVDDLPE